MAKGKKYNDDIKERALAELEVNNSTSYVAEKLGLPRTTVKSWKEAYDREAEKSGEPSIAELRQKNKEKFVEKAWGIIGDAQNVIERRLKRAISSEDKLDELVDEICKLDGKELSTAQRKALYSKIATIKVESVKELAVVLGTLYDKQALANKEATTIIEGEVTVKKFEDL